MSRLIPDPNHQTPLTFEKGLNEFYEPSTLPAGSAPVCHNWIPEANGGLRCVRGWNSASQASLTGARTSRGIGHFVHAGVQSFYVAQATNSTTYQLSYLPKSNLSSGTWAVAETVTADPSTRPLAMADGAGVLLYCTPEFPSAFIRSWDGASASDASADAIAGRTLVYYNNRFFSAGSLADPTFLRWSELGDSTTWTTDTNFQPIGQDDGEPIEDLAGWDRNLFIGKENSIWYQAGFGPDTFAWKQLDGGGCAPGRTLVTTPTGVVAIGRDQVWFFSGGAFSPISQPIENSYGMSGDYMTGAYCNGYVYICDEGSGTIWCWNEASGVWHTEGYDTQAEGPNTIAGFGKYLLAGTTAAATNSLLLYRLEPGGARQRNAGDTMTFHAKSPEMWIAGPKYLTAINNVYFRLRQRGGTSIQTPLTITFYTAGEVVSTKDVTPEDTTGAVEIRKDIEMSDAYEHEIEFTQTVGIAESDLFDIEETIINFQVNTGKR